MKEHFSVFIFFGLILLVIGFGIWCDHRVKMRELDLVENGIIKKEITEERNRK